MTNKKVPSAPYLMRRIGVIQKRYERAVELRREQAKQVKKYKDQLTSVLEGKVRENRELGVELQRAKESLASNNMTITELNQQVAMQWKQRAESKSDVERATKLCAEAVAKHNRMVTTYQELKTENLSLQNQVLYAKDDLARAVVEIAEARLTFQYRAWQALTKFSFEAKWAIRDAFTDRKSRIVNWWVIKRLNKSRVNAMNEAGYIPDKLIKMAHEYWEHDKQRMGETIETWGSGYNAGAQHVARQTPWRRFRIWMGRA